VWGRRRVDALFGFVELRRVSAYENHTALRSNEHTYVPLFRYELSNELVISPFASAPYRIHET